MSILFTITIGRSPCANALPRTNFVCGIGPSAASVRRITPSAICKTRSTSPPKSAWPGVSIILIRTPSHNTEVGFARIVMPRSFSRSPESSSRSSTFWLSRNIPLWRRIESINVVLPWSTWAMIAIFRNSSDIRIKSLTVTLTLK